MMSWNPPFKGSGSCARLVAAPAWISAGSARSPRDRPRRRASLGRDGGGGASRKTQRPRRESGCPAALLQVAAPAGRTKGAPLRLWGRRRPRSHPANSTRGEARERTRSTLKEGGEGKGKAAGGGHRAAFYARSRGGERKGAANALPLQSCAEAPSPVSLFAAKARFTKVARRYPSCDQQTGRPPRPASQKEEEEEDERKGGRAGEGAHPLPTQLA